jgi:hypothetical protein
MFDAFVTEIQKFIIMFILIIAFLTHLINTQVTACPEGEALTFG